MVKCRIWAITVLVAFIMVMSAGAVSAASPFSDVEGADCEQAVTVLYALDLIEGRTADMYAPYVQMTRAELATVIMRFMDLETETGSGTVFTDVDPAHWACGNIEAAYGMGIILGMGDGTFAPDENVTFAQAIKMFVCTLGYDVHAQASGGYPAGYMTKAAQLGLLKGVTVTGADTAITRSDMAIIMYNMLDVDLLTQTSYGEGAAGAYEEADGKTLLSEYRGVYMTEGVIDADYYTQINQPESRVDRNSLAIDGNVYAIGETDAAKYLGYNVKAYYMLSEETGEPVLLYAAPAQGMASITLNASDISEETTETNIEYTDEQGNEKTFAVDSGATLVLNGVVKPEWDRTDLTPALGTVTAIDNRGADDVIIVDAYTNYVVRGKNLNQNKVYFKEAVNGTSEMEIDIKDTSKRIMLSDASGAEITLEALAEWDILSLARGEGDAVIKIIKSSDKVTGKVTESSEQEVVIAGKTYDVDPALPYGALAAPQLNMTADFRLDFMGNIAAVDTDSAATFKYGYLLGALNKKGIGGTGQFKVFTEDGEMIFFDAADRVILNGTSYSASEVVSNIPLKTLWAEPTDGTGAYQGKKIYSPLGTTIRQLIRYVANDDNTKITEIETATDVTANPLDYSGNAGFNMVVELAANAAAMTPTSTLPDGTVEEKVSANASSRWNGQYTFNAGAMNGFAGKFVYDANTKFFVIPEEDEPDSEYQMRGVPALHDAFPGAMFYDLSEGNTIGAIVWDKGAAASMGSASSDLKIEFPPTDSDKFAMFLGTIKAMDEDGETITKVRLLHSDKTEKTFVLPDNLAFAAWSANTNLGSDPVLSQGDRKGTGSSRYAAQTTPDCYLEPEELRYGDIINYSTDIAATTIEAAAVLMRSTTPGMYEVGFSANRWITITDEMWYAGGDLLASGIVKTVTPTSLVLETSIGTGAGEPGTDTILRTMSRVSTPLVVALDIAKGTHEIISYDDVVEGDVYAMVWTTLYPNFFIVYR